jgi:hypothetical protein
MELRLIGVSAAEVRGWSLSRAACGEPPWMCGVCAQFNAEKLNEKKNQEIGVSIMHLIFQNSESIDKCCMGLHGHVLMSRYFQVHWSPS